MNNKVRDIYKSFNSKIFSIIGFGQDILPNKQEIKDLRSKLSVLRQEDETILVESVGPFLYDYQEKIRAYDIDFFTKDVDRDATIAKLKEGHDKMTANTIERYTRVLLNTLLDTIDQIDNNDKAEIMKMVNDMLVDYCRINVFKNTGNLV